MNIFYICIYRFCCYVLYFIHSLLKFLSEFFFNIQCRFYSEFFNKLRIKFQSYLMMLDDDDVRNRNKLMPRNKKNARHKVRVE